MYIKKIIVAIALLGLLVMGGFSYYVYNAVFVSNTSFNNTEAHVYIGSNFTFENVVEELSPLLEDIETFKVVARKKEYTSGIKPGHYILKKGMNNNDIINVIRSQNTPITIKFNNQERLENLAGQISKQLEQDSLAFLNSFKDSIFLKENNFDLDTALGMYVPNTYEVYWNTSPEAFRSRMLKEYTAFWNSKRTNQLQVLGLSKNQVISLASIVQKETAKVDERPRVAGVYVNRIKKGMLLQADPTVIYAKKRAENNYDLVIKRVLYKDLEIDSPYNTYKYVGVPPGPISMPDISSIDAVLNYENHSFYYFVADVNNLGYHKFAKTLTQHNRNKNEYVRWVNKQGIKR